MTLQPNLQVNQPQAAIRPLSPTLRGDGEAFGEHSVTVGEIVAAILACQYVGLRERQVRGLCAGLLASGGDDGLVRLWRVDTMLEIGRLPHGSHVWDVAFDPSGTQLQSTANDGITRRWVIGTEQPLAPGYLADQVVDQPVSTWIDEDVDAFARLIASRHMSPPLSIGIFGEWGAGKTYFMRRLQTRVGRLSLEAGGFSICIA